MKKISVLCLSIVLSLLFGKELMAQTYEIECISVEQDGSQTLRVWGKGRNKKDAIEQAKKNAVYEVLFNGVIKGNNGYNQRPIITEVNARERHSEYFDSFFTDNGDYLKFISMEDKRLGSTERKINSKQVNYCITVRVLIPQLRQHLITDSIIQTNK